METETNATILTRGQLDQLAELARSEGLPHPAAPGVTWQTLQNLAAAGRC